MLDNFFLLFCFWFGSVVLVQPMEVPVMLSKLRQQRMLMVQTISQYKFVYQVLIHFLKNSRLI